MNNQVDYNQYFKINIADRPALPSAVKHVYMIGICGMGMGTLAAMLQTAGYQVCGSDSAIYPPMSTHLAELGIQVLAGYNSANLERPIDLVVVGNVVRRDNLESQAVQRLRLPYLSMAETLERLFIAQSRSIVVAGTHGKTTTSGLIAWTLYRAGLDPGFMVGGLLANFNASHRLAGRPGDPFVTEGDEYDTAWFDKGPKFLHYRPDVLVLNNVEFDHADIYRDLDHVLWAFGRLLDNMSSDQLLVAGADCPNVRRLIRGRTSRLVSFGLEDANRLRARDVRFEQGLTEFTPLLDGRPLERVFTPLLGEHNVRNVLACYAVARELGVDEQEFRAAMREFQGVARRAQVLLDKSVKVIDDFAHHPTAVATTLDGLAASHPGRRLLAAFEPRSATSRSACFQQQYAASLARAALVFLAPVHQPERLDPQLRLDLDKLAADINSRGGECLNGRDSAELFEMIVQRARPGDVLVFMSNGGFDGLPRRAAQALSERYG